jgi:hypothetical protein
MAMEVFSWVIIGGEVAAFVKKHFAEELKKNTHYLQKNY